MDSLHVVPSFFEEGDQEVKTHHDVSSELFVSHIFTSSATSHVGDLSELELNGTTDVLDLEDKRGSLSDHGREHLDSVKNGSNDDGNFLEDGIGSDKELILFGPFLDEFLVLVEFFEGVKISDFDINVLILNFCLVLCISDNADFKVGTGDVGKTDGTDETFVLLGIVVLKSELDFNRLSEFSLFVVSSKLLDGVSDECVVDFGSHLVY